MKTTGQEDQVTRASAAPEHFKCCKVQHLLVLKRFKCRYLQHVLVLERFKCCELQHLLVLNVSDTAEYNIRNASNAVNHSTCGLGTFQMLQNTALKGTGRPSDQRTAGPGKTKVPPAQKNPKCARRPGKPYEELHPPLFFSYSRK